jgi:hypothetical protein
MALTFVALDIVLPAVCFMAGLSTLTGALTDSGATAMLAKTSNLGFASAGII